MKRIIFCFLLFSSQVFAQDDLLEGLEEELVDNSVESAFKSLKIVNLESTKLTAKGDLYFIVSHRFGAVDDGIKEFFGLDQATTNLKFVYGLTDYLNLTASRNSFQKTYELAIKYRFLNQKKNGCPVSLVGFNSITANTFLSKSNLPLLTFTDRLAYASQLLISRKMNDKLSLELAPSYLHLNLVSTTVDEKNDQYILAGGGRYKLSNRVALTFDYGYNFSRPDSSIYYNACAVGVDIETGGHVFQLHFSNAQPMFEAGFLSRSSGNWLKGNVFFGFNMVRVF
jgi:hypothetical protein